MPLFMDLHISPNGAIAIYNLIKKHQADLATQRKYGVEFKSMWVNKEKGMIFCLMKAPDKQACINVHQKAYKDTGCNIIEVSPGEYDKFLASGVPNANAIAESQKGVMDNAYRTILRFEIVNPLHREKVNSIEIESAIKENNGTLILEPHHSINAVFVYASDAFKSARQIMQAINKSTIDYKLNIVSGKPVEENNDKFYGYAIDLVKKMTLSNPGGCIQTTQLTADLLKKEGLFEPDQLKNTSVLSSKNEQFLNHTLITILQNFKKPEFNTIAMAREMLLSRSQLFKKIKHITKFTPNTLIREVRLYEALKLLEDDNDQIAQVALETGFNSPSYFSKVFAKRFGILPTLMMKYLEV